jgi:hypothetical protein
MFDNIKQNKVIFIIFGIYLAALAKEVSMLLTYRQQADYRKPMNQDIYMEILDDFFGQMQKI